MRAFIAVELSDEQKDKLEVLQGELKGVGIDAKFTTRGQMHITLRFLGEIEDVEEVKSGLDECGGAKFNLEMKGMGVFPSKDYIKVVWVGVGEGREELAELKKKIDENVKVGKKDSREFHAHATLCRVKSVRGKEKILEILEKHVGESFGVKEVSEVKLIKSTLTPEGPVCEELHRVELETIPQNE